ncbi:MAG: pilus assembly protein PilM [Candidatus Delongbacteria bacterium]|nr:pilus assembly protein PilM [Candidatus Delongbacteria bacterium]
MTDDPQNESKSLGRNIFAENKPPISEKKVEIKTNEDQQPSESRSIGRNMFSEPLKEQSSAAGESGEFEIRESSSLLDKTSKKSKPVKSSGKSKLINALHITDENVVFAQTFYDGANYKLSNLQVVPIELPKLTEENVFKDKEDPIIARKRLQLEAINRVFSNAGVSKNDPHIVSALTGNKIIIKEVFLKNTPEENIEIELPKVLQSPFDAFSRYEYLKLSSTGTDHRILASIVDSKIFFGYQSFLNSAEVECKILDIDKMALINLYNESVNPPIGTVACIIDIGEDSSNIIIVPNGNEELYIRSIDFTGSQFRKMLQKNRDISSEETEEMLRTRNFYDYITKAFEAETTENLNQHYGVKKYIRMQLLRELQKTFQYYSGQNHNKIPTKIYVTGKAVGMNKFPQFITKNTDIPCEYLDVAGFFEGDGNMIKYANETQDVCYTCLGLALRYE